MLERLNVWSFPQDWIHFLREACAFFLRCWNRAVYNRFVDKLFLAGVRFIAPRQTQSHGKAYGTATMILMAVHVVEQTAYMLAQGIIEHQLKTPPCFSLKL